MDPSTLAVTLPPHGHHTGRSAVGGAIARGGLVALSKPVPPAHLGSMGALPRAWVPPLPTDVASKRHLAPDAFEWGRGRSGSVRGTPSFAESTTGSVAAGEETLEEAEARLDAMQLHLEQRRVAGHRTTGQAPPSPPGGGDRQEGGGPEEGGGLGERRGGGRHEPQEGLAAAARRGLAHTAPTSPPLSPFAGGVGTPGQWVPFEPRAPPGIALHRLGSRPGSSGGGGPGAGDFDELGQEDQLPELDAAFEALSSHASVGSENGNVSYVSGASGLEEPLTLLRLSEESEDM